MLYDVYAYFPDDAEEDAFETVRLVEADSYQDAADIGEEWIRSGVFADGILPEGYDPSKGTIFLVQCVGVDEFEEVS
jgi:hypothetical protein